jgi:photosystem II stability/assembly factor-like uncharacterized protein
MDDGSARVSADMGRSWAATPVLPERPTRLLEQEDGSLAWMSSDLRVRRSPDGGRSWTTVPYGPGAPWIRELWFFDARDGLALTLDGQQAHSGDGGRSWSPRASPLRLRGLHAAADGSAWALDGERLMRSTDRGRSWSAQPLPAAVTDTGGLLDARRIDARLGWVRTERRTCIVAPRPICFSESSHLFVTEDGGATWALRATLGRGETDRAVAMTGGGLMLRILQDGRVLRSANAGRDWMAVPALAASFAPDNPLSIVWVGSTHAWLYGGDRVWRSADGGLTWQGVPAPLLPWGSPLRPQSMAFADSRHGWAVGSTAHVMVTRDGGASWDLQPTDSGYGFETVFALDAQRVWLGGHEGVMATATGGD